MKKLFRFLLLTLFVIPILSRNLCLATSVSNMDALVVATDKLLILGTASNAVGGSYVVAITFTNVANLTNKTVRILPFGTTKAVTFTFKTNAVAATDVAITNSTAQAATNLFNKLPGAGLSNLTLNSISFSIFTNTVKVTGTNNTTVSMTATGNYAIVTITTNAPVFTPLTGAGGGGSGIDGTNDILSGSTWVGGIVTNIPAASAPTMPVRLQESTNNLANVSNTLAAASISNRVFVTAIGTNNTPIAAGVVTKIPYNFHPSPGGMTQYWSKADSRFTPPRNGHYRVYGHVGMNRAAANADAALVGISTNDSSTITETARLYLEYDLAKSNSVAFATSVYLTTNSLMSVWVKFSLAANLTNTPHASMLPNKVSVVLEYAE